jgi:hypothetical protein
VLALPPEPAAGLAHHFARAGPGVRCEREEGLITVVQVLRVWRLVRPDRSSLRVRLVRAGRGVRLEVQAAESGAGRTSVACARYVDGGWSVRMPVSRRTAQASSWAVALHRMTQELHSLLPGRLIRLSPSPPGSSPAERARR